MPLGKYCLIAVLLFVGTAVGASEQEVDTEWAAFKAKYGRVYSSQSEHDRRKEIFRVNLDRAAEMQKFNPQARFGVTQFSDESREEFGRRLNGGKTIDPKTAIDPSRVRSDLVVKMPLPPMIDWRQHNAVTYVKNQGTCGSCWSFSTTGNIEGQWALAGNTLTALSEQELVSCDVLSLGCGGTSSTDTGVLYLLKYTNGTIATEISYPYMSQTKYVPQCDMHNRSFGAQITSYYFFPPQEDVIANGLYKQGPLSVTVDADSWQFYHGGVLTNCLAEKLNHAVLLVGFNPQGGGEWTIKNSWGPSWGEEGYIRIGYGTNQCLIEQMAFSSTIGAPKM